MYVERNIVAHWRNHFCRGKAMSTTCYDCVCVFLPSLSGMQIGSFMRRIILSFVARLTLLYFFHIIS